MVDWRFSMTMIPNDQMPYRSVPDQFDWMKLRAPRAIPVPQMQLQQPTAANVVVDALGKLLVLGVGAAAVFGVCDLLFGEKKTVRCCSACGRAGHTAGNCPITGPRTRLTVEKIGACECCGGDFSYTEAHHYAGRGVDRGKEMCAPCHFHCGHGGHWKNRPINPRYCRFDG
jgi:hypothetical protein